MISHSFIALCHRCILIISIGRRLPENMWLPLLCSESLGCSETLCGVLQHPQLVKQHHIEKYQQYQARAREGEKTQRDCISEPHHLKLLTEMNRPMAEMKVPYTDPLECNWRRTEKQVDCNRVQHKNKARKKCTFLNIHGVSEYWKQKQLTVGADKKCQKKWLYLSGSAH